MLELMKNIELIKKSFNKW